MTSVPELSSNCFLNEVNIISILCFDKMFFKTD